MTPSVSDLAPLAIASVAAVVWLVRLEAKANNASANAKTVAEDLIEARGALSVELAGIKAKADHESLKHNATIGSLIRVEEQLKYLTGLFERQFIDGVVRTRARAPRRDP